MPGNPFVPVSGDHHIRHKAVIRYILDAAPQRSITWGAR